MIDPADSVTRPLPQPAHMRFSIDDRVCTVVLDQDLLGDWTVMQSWAGKEGRRGGGKVTPVEDYAAGLSLLQAIAKRREKYGYRMLSR